MGVRGEAMPQTQVQPCTAPNAGTASTLSFQTDWENASSHLQLTDWTPSFFLLDETTIETKVFISQFLSV